MAPDSPAVPDATTLLEHVADGVVVAGADGRVRWLNPAGERLTGRSVTRATGHTLEEVFSGAPDIAVIARRARETQSPVARDGIALVPGGATARFDVDAIATPLASADGREAGGVVLTLRDRTVARSLEADQRQADRLDSFSTVAAGIAHEVKNPLGGIRGAAQLLGRMLSRGTQSRQFDEEQVREYLELIVGEVDRIASLVDRLRDLSSAADERGAREPIDLNRLLHELCRLQSSTGEAPIDLDLDPSLPRVDGRADDLRRLFLNLLRNALEAPATRVRVATRVDTGRRWRDRDGRLHALVVASVTDDGPGIPGEHRARLFEPFFTTKAKGTGLGLAAVQRIVRDHDGTVVAEDAPSGHGARFTVTLPACGGPS